MRVGVHKYEKIDKEFLDYLYDAVIKEGWSFQYACRYLKGGVCKTRRELHLHPRLRDIKTMYMNRLKDKVYMGFRNSNK